MTAQSTSTQRSSRRPLRALAVLLATIAVLIGLAGPASAATAAAGNYTGNACNGARIYLDNAGSEGCVRFGAFTPNSRILLQNGAYDYGRDGYSARSIVRIYQYVNGTWQHTHNLSTATASNGFGTSYLAPAEYVPRVAGATHFRVQIQSCIYNRPTNTHPSCATTHWGYSWNG